MSFDVTRAGGSTGSHPVEGQSGKGGFSERRVTDNTGDAFLSDQDRKAANMGAGITSMDHIQQSGKGIGERPIRSERHRKDDLNDLLRVLNSLDPNMNFKFEKVPNEIGDGNEYYIISTNANEINTEQLAKLFEKAKNIPGYTIRQKVEQYLNKILNNILPLNILNTENWTYTGKDRTGSDVMVFKDFVEKEKADKLCVALNNFLPPIKGDRSDKIRFQVRKSPDGDNYSIVLFVRKDSNVKGLPASIHKIAFLRNTILTSSMKWTKVEIAEDKIQIISNPEQKSTCETQLSVLNRIDPKIKFELVQDREGRGYRIAINLTPDKLAILFEKAANFVEIRRFLRNITTLDLSALIQRIPKVSDEETKRAQQYLSEVHLQNEWQSPKVFVFSREPGKLVVGYDHLHSSSHYSTSSLTIENIHAITTQEIDDWNNSKNLRKSLQDSVNKGDLKEVKENLDKFRKEFPNFSLLYKFSVDSRFPPTRLINVAITKGNYDVVELLLQYDRPNMDAITFLNPDDVVDTGYRDMLRDAIRRDIKLFILFLKTGFFDEDRIKKEMQLIEGEYWQDKNILLEKVDTILGNLKRLKDTIMAGAPGIEDSNVYDIIIEYLGSDLEYHLLGKPPPKDRGTQ